jgi:hypothetical protein
MTAALDRAYDGIIVGAGHHVEAVCASASTQ